MAKGGKGSGSGSLLKGLSTGNDLAYRPDLTSIIVKMRAVNGQFKKGAGVHTALVNVHTKMATEVQELMAEELRDAVENRGRPQRETFLLEKALIDERNRDVNVSGFIVGTKWMDESPARGYYRGLEEGSSKLVGRLIMGFFTDREYQGRFAPQEGRLDARMVQLDQDDAGVRNAARRPALTGVHTFRIKRPIPAYEYMRKGVERWEASDKARTYYDQIRQQYAAVLK